MVPPVGLHEQIEYIQICTLKVCGIKIKLQFIHSARYLICNNERNQEISEK